MTRRAHRRQRGALLPALALVLLGGGGALWLGGTLGDPVPGVDESRRRLLDARRALLAHVSAYPESYGPGGAGPGHLPCPDADTRPSGRPASASDPFRGDGPDPPCGNGATALGHLPRHVSLPSHRELFHREETQRFLYAVSTRFVNNPLDRRVNPDSGEVSGSAMRDEIVALIIDAGDTPLLLGLDAGDGEPPEVLERVRSAVREAAGVRAAARVQHVPVRRTALLATAGRRVAAWFVTTATRVARRRCPSGGEAEGADCPRWPGLDRACEPADGERLLEWLTDGPLPAFDASPGSCPAVAPAPPPKTLENTPLERHWFVRNGWHRFVALEVDAGCRRSAARCTLRLVRGDAVVPAIRLAPPTDGVRR